MANKSYCDGSDDTFVVTDNGDLLVRNPTEKDGAVRALVLAQDVPEFLAWLKEATNG